MRHVQKEANTASSSKKRPISLKYPVDRLALLDKAVKLHPNSDRTKYIIDAVNKAVEEDLLDRRQFFLSDEDFKAFEDILKSPAQELTELKALFSEKAPWEK